VNDFGPSAMTQIRKGRSVPDLALALRLSQQTGIPVEAFAPAKAHEVKA